MHLTQFFDLGPRNEYCAGPVELGGAGGHNLSNSNLGGGFSAVFLQFQKSNCKLLPQKVRHRISVMNHWCFCCLQDKMGIRMPIFWNY